MEIKMPYEAEWIIKKIRERGFEAFAVGGCVRDTLLGRIPGDWDITTSARPEEVKEIFGKTVDTGLQHGTVTIIKNHRGYEVTTYRIDGEYLDGRHPDSVEFTSSLTEDLKRRDFTINAMAYSHETGIVDEFGGMEDLEKKIIRCVGRAHDRFTEDALRILRAIRFAAQLNFDIEEETYRAIADIAPNLKKVSKERIQVELTKLLLSDHPEKLLMVEETGISPFVTEDFSEAFRSWDKVQKILKGLKLDNETVGNSRAMVEGYHAFLAPDKTEIRRAMSMMTPYQLDGSLRLKELDGDKSIPKIRCLWEEIKEAGDCVSLKTLAVGGNDLIAAGVMPGKAVGETLKMLLELVLSDPSLNQRELLLQRVSTVRPPLQ